MSQNIDDLVIEILEDARLRRAKLLPGQLEAVEEAVRAALQRQRFFEEARDEDRQWYILPEEKNVVPI
jgi:hypothetical protein